MKQMGCKPFIADPDLWMRPKTRKSDGLGYYYYVLIYVDYVFAIGDEPEEVLKWVDKYFGLKPVSLDDLNIYLGASVKFMILLNDVMAWSLCRLSMFRKR